MEITVEFLEQQKKHLEAERSRALAFIANADGGLSMIDVMLERLKEQEVKQ